MNPPTGETHPVEVPHRLDPESQELRAVAADTGQSLDDRITALEDIIESEVGDTSLSRARNIEREVGLRQIYLKFEGGNPTGTHKDRIACAQVLDALRRGFDTITVASCGNYGAAIAFAASLCGMRCTVHIPADYHTRRIDEITRLGADIRRVAGDYEAAVASSREQAAKDECYDGNPGGPNTDLQLRAYGQIAYEIYDELRDAPAAVGVPVSNGTLLAGIHRGFAGLYRRGKTSRIPRMVAGSSFRKNPIVRAWCHGRPNCEDLPPSSVRETGVNEPLVNWHSIDGDQALADLRASDGWAAYGSDKTMTSWSRRIREQEGLSVLPASTAGLIALLDGHSRGPLPGDRYVAILTGRRA
jgi:threonine synthase